MNRKQWIDEELMGSSQYSRESWLVRCHISRFAKRLSGKRFYNTNVFERELISLIVR